MSETTGILPLRAPRSWLKWPYELFIWRFDVQYDWQYLSKEDSFFCSLLCAHAMITQGIVVFALLDIAVMPRLWDALLLVAFAGAIFYAVESMLRYRLYRAAVRATDAGKAGQTREAAALLSDVVGFMLFPYWASNRITTVCGVTLQFLLASVALRQTFGGTDVLHVQPFPKPTALFILVAGSGLYALAYASYRKPTWQAALDRLIKE